MPNLLFYNTLTHKKEVFQPLVPQRAGLYVCGITPYDETHLGHARCYVVFDILKRVLLHYGYNVTHIQNFTDVDDKIIERANKHNMPADRYAEPFIKSFNDYMKRLNILPADQYPRVTTHIPEIINLIETLVQKGLAYESEGTVYYAVRKFPGYGRLSHRKLDDLEAGARVERDERKNDPFDFALWKKAKPKEPAWPSPWGLGRPGWHIECSAMSMKYLGEAFDIHGGGQDLIFPHHENEIAQSVGATGKEFARLWVHNGFVTVNQQKMSKSLGNFFTLKDIFGQFEPMVVRYFLLTQHYRSPLNFSDQELKAAQTTWLERIQGAHRIALEREGAASAGSATVPPAFEEALRDDLNTPAALAVLNGVVRQIYSIDKEWNSTVSQNRQKIRENRLQLKAMLDVLGLNLPQSEDWNEGIKSLIQEREEARRSRNWARADEIRKELESKGIFVEDTPQGSRLKRL